jgi:hypothetical protein
MEDRLKKANDVFNSLKNMIIISNENVELQNAWDNLVKLFQGYILEFNIYDFHILKLRKTINLYMLNNNDDVDSYVGSIKIQESETIEDIQRYFNEFIHDKSIITMNLLYKILGESAKSIKRRIEQNGAIGGDTETMWAYDIQFVDNDDTLYNMNFWIPKIEEQLDLIESFFHNSNSATIWILKK